jgi:hypothetical protein
VSGGALLDGGEDWACFNRLRDLGTVSDKSGQRLGHRSHRAYLGFESQLLLDSPLAHVAAARRVTTAQDQQIADLGLKTGALCVLAYKLLSERAA